MISRDRIILRFLQSISLCPELPGIFFGGGRGIVSRPPGTLQENIVLVPGGRWAAEVDERLRWSAAW